MRYTCKQVLTQYFHPHNRRLPFRPPVERDREEADSTIHGWAPREQKEDKESEKLVSSSERGIINMEMWTSISGNPKNLAAPK